MTQGESVHALQALEESVLNKIDEATVVAFHQALVRVPSVNPPGDVRAAFEICDQAMRDGGFATASVGDLEEMPNLIATYGNLDGPTLCFNAHLDVVPVGERAAWAHEPFGAEIHDGRILSLIHISEPTRRTPI